MNIVVLRSVGTGSVPPSEERAYVQQRDTAFAERVLGNLLDRPGYCRACEGDCTGCRRSYEWPFGRSLAAVVDVPADLPYLLESPSDHVPDGMPPHDVLLAVCVHEQVLLEVLRRCPGWGTKAVVVPPAKRPKCRYRDKSRS